MFHPLRQANRLASVPVCVLQQQLDRKKSRLVKDQRRLFIALTQI
jgi:hypothetical protein